LKEDKNKEDKRTREELKKKKERWNRKKRKGITKEIVENRNNKFLFDLFIEKFDVKIYLAEKA